MVTIMLHDGRSVTVTESGHVYVFPPGDTNEVSGYSLTLPAVTPRRSKRRIRQALLATLQVR